jgi:hypothetical protein
MDGGFTGLPNKVVASCNTHALGLRHKGLFIDTNSITVTHPPLYLYAMDRLTDFFNQPLTPEQSAEIESSYQHINDTRNTNLRAMPPDPLSNPQMHTKLKDLDASALDLSALHDMIQESAMADSKLRFPPPEVLPCANVETEKYRACQNPGKMACSSCRLVSYCSKVSSVV